MSNEVRDVIQLLLNPECHLRLKAQGLKVHPYLASVDWSTIRQQRAPFVPRPEHDQDTSYFEGMMSIFANIQVYSIYFQTVLPGLATDSRHSAKLCRLFRSNRRLQRPGFLDFPGSPRYQSREAHLWSFPSLMNCFVLK